MRILLTGATGFIGSAIATELIARGFEVYATHRSGSSFDRCQEIRHLLHWINTDNANWKEAVKLIQPNLLIHAAWGGVGIQGRNDWNIQLQNFYFSKDLFDLAADCHIQQVIALGSQAEYGSTGLVATENTIPQPDDAYGAIKLLTLNYLRQLFDKTLTSWFWIRVFSVFGEKEQSDWLIPTVIHSLLNQRSIKLTNCEQKYNYLYINDFTKLLMAVVENSKAEPGIYNLCHSTSFSLKELLTQLAKLMGVSEQLLQFGALPYRPGQNMLITGDNTKFKEHFNMNETFSEDLSYGLIRTINYYKKRQQ
ncbi:MAG: NAD(P)-dependent oxidoreductase [Bacteroidota bacterium]|nr:NAD(P)-dependent oxidoreductase [Bacteroidota bacterium]